MDNLEVLPPDHVNGFTLGPLRNYVDFDKLNHSHMISTVIGNQNHQYYSSSLGMTIQHFHDVGFQDGPNPGLNPLLPPL